LKGIIIAGGLGTRLRPLTLRRPKPLIPVANRPFLEYQVALLKRHGIDDIVFATNYLAEMIEEHFGDGSRFGVRMRYALEDTPLGTGGAIRNAADVFPGETVAVFNGDILTDFDLSEIIRFHTDRQAAATITLAPVQRPHPFGVVSLTGDGQVAEWREPSEEEKRAAATASTTDEGRRTTDLINAGFYVISPEAVEQIPQGRKSSIEREIFPKLIAEGSVYGVSPGGFWLDVGRPEQLLMASRAVVEGLVGTDLPLTRIGRDVQISPTATVDDLSVIGDGCVIGAHARVTNSVLLCGASVGNAATLNRAIVDKDGSIKDGAVLIDVVS
jgi:NDP-sugar pyrophosphorylase family protein